MMDRKENLTWFQRNLVALVGFGIQILVFGIYIGRQEQIKVDLERRIALLEQKVDVHVSDADRHTYAEWRQQILQALIRLEAKVDARLSVQNK
jgi:hypothetical protein